jgi:hypothetical protein
MPKRLHDPGCAQFTSGALPGMFASERKRDYFPGYVC